MNITQIQSIDKYDLKNFYEIFNNTIGAFPRWAKANGVSLGKAFHSYFFLKDYKSGEMKDFAERIYTADDATAVKMIEQITFRGSVKV